MTLIVLLGSLQYDGSRGRGDKVFEVKRRKTFLITGFPWPR